MIFQNRQKDKEIHKALAKIEGKIDVLDQRIDRVENHLAEYNGQLTVHIKRTDMSENRLKTLEYTILGVLLSSVVGAITFALKYLVN